MAYTWANHISGSESQNGGNFTETVASVAGVEPADVSTAGGLPSDIVTVTNVG